jgi:hypothetical protein
VKYGFLDESGDVSYAPGAADNLVVAVVVVGHPERLRKAVVRTRKGLGKRFRTLPELKATRDAPRLVEKLLVRVIDIGFDAVAVVADKRRIVPPEDPEALYRQVCARAVREALTRFGSLSLTLDRRYTAARQQHQLGAALVACLENMEGVALAIEYEDSQKEKALQVADAIAWTVFQRYERGDETLWQVIRERVVEVRL